MVGLTEIVIAQGIISAVLAGFVASEKGRDWLRWSLIGFVCSFYALIALAALPNERHSASLEEKLKRHSAG